MNRLIEKALEIATKAHDGQVDKAGKEYIEHPKYVASLVDTDYEVVTALLHDVIEDTDVTIDYLIEQGMPPEVVIAIDVLTKKQNIDYFDYLENVKRNSIARNVKYADLTHNSDISRLVNPTKEDYERIKKYNKAMAYLKE